MFQVFGSRVNWIDLVCLFLVIRTTYVGYRNGLSVEIFKFLGIVSAVIISMSGYSFIAGLISGFISQSAAEVISFIAIVAVVMFAFSIIRRLLSFLFKLQPINWLERGAGLILGLARGFILVSLVLIILTMTQNEYLNSSIRNESFSGNFFLEVAPKIYMLSTRTFPNFNSGPEALNQ